MIASPVERHTVAAYLNVKNCPVLLAECLDHLKWVDEILVADASTNDAVARMLAERYPDVTRVEDHTQDHRLRLENNVDRIQSDFILGLDADEFFTPEAAAEIVDALRKPCAYDGFKIPSVSYVFGECLGEGTTQLRLFRKDKYRWPMRSPHEMVEVTGPVGVLTRPYAHHNNPSLSLVPIKTFRYEASHAAQLDDHMVDRLAIDNKGLLDFWRRVFIEWARMNVRFFRALTGRRGSRFTRLCLAYAQMLHTMARHVCPTEERRMRSGLITRDRHGYY